MALASAFSGLALGCGCSHLSGSRLQTAHPARLARPAAPALVECAHKKGGGSTKNGRDSNAQRRGVKVYGGQRVKAGGIIVRQLGTVFHPGDSVGCGKDHTLFALKSGIVVYKRNKYIKKVSVIDTEEYVVPEGQRVQPGSRKMRNHEKYPPRAELRAQAQADLAAAIAKEQATLA